MDRVCPGWCRQMKFLSAAISRRNTDERQRIPDFHFFESNEGCSGGNAQNLGCQLPSTAPALPGTKAEKQHIHTAVANTVETPVLSDLQPHSEGTHQALNDEEGKADVGDSHAATVLREAQSHRELETAQPGFVAGRGADGATHARVSIIISVSQTCALRIKLPIFVHVIVCIRNMCLYIYAHPYTTKLL
eukprot:scaffold185760_cov16-Prasinocladus_malaysianus.AAC.1